MTDQSQMTLWEPSFDGFVFSEETSFLSRKEFESACVILQQIETAMMVPSPSIARPDMGWSTKRKFRHAEIDSSIQDFQTSFALLMRRDPDIIRKLRLYAQTFSGYQLATLRPANVDVPWIRDKLPVNYDDFLHIIASRSCQWSMRYILLAAGLSPALRLSLPEKFGEIGLRYGGKIANFDSFYYLTYISIMHEFGLLDGLQSLGRTAHVLEVGGGFGGFAYMLCKTIRDVRYVIVDLPESLAFAAIYLSVLFPGLSASSQVIKDDVDFTIPDSPGFTFIPSALFHRATFNSVDLAVNINSFAEMSAAQVDWYCRRIADVLAPVNGVLFDHNHEYSDETSETLVATISRCFEESREICSVLPTRAAFGPSRLWGGKGELS